MSKIKYSSRMATGLIGIMAMTGAAIAGNAPHRGQLPDMLPPNPETGECYARVEIPAQYSTGSETVMVQDGYRELQVSEPQLKSRQENVLVKEASVHYEVRQPTYKHVSEQIMTRPAYDRLAVVPPQFKNITETIGVSEPRLVWKKGNPAQLTAQGYKVHSTADAGAGGRGYRSTREYGNSRLRSRAHSSNSGQGGAMHCGPTCEIWCLVEEPGQSVSYNRKVMTSPGDVRRVPVPAKYTTVHKQVVADRGGVREIPIPAEYRAITIEKVNKKAKVRKVDVPPVYSDVSKRVLVSPSRYEWRRVVCAPGTHPQGRRVVSSPARTYSAPTHTSSTYAAPTYSGSTHSSRTYSGAPSAGTVSSRTYGSTGSSGYTSSGYPSSSYAAPAPSAVTGTGYYGTEEYPSYGGASFDKSSAGASSGHSSASGQLYGSKYPLDMPTYSSDYRLPAPTRR